MTPPYVVVYNNDANIAGGQARDSIASRDNLNAIQPVAQSLRSLGPVDLLAIDDGDPLRTGRALERLRPRAVFNLVESVRGVAELEAAFAGLLDLLAVPYTGNNPQTLGLCLDKPKTKAVLTGLGIRVPRGHVMRDPADRLTDVVYPAIVKPACLDGSHGIEPGNVVHTEDAARAKVAELLRCYPPAVVVEEFIDGRELSATVLSLGPACSPEMLPVTEIDWRLPAGTPRVCGYEAKWMEDTAAYRDTPVTCPAVLACELERRVRDISIAAFEAVGGRDYARVDLRIDAAGDPVVLEVNPNPCLVPNASVARAAEAGGCNYDRLIQRIVRNAERRARPHPTSRPN